MTARSFLILFFTICFVPRSWAQQALLQREIEKLIIHESEIDFDVVPGILVGVMDGDSTYICSFGKAINPNTAFELGSVTKPYVAGLVRQALDSLGWRESDSVCRFLPDSLCSPEWKRLTVEQILEHRGGLLRLPLGLGKIERNIQDPYSDYNISLFARDIKSIEPVPAMYSYSHVGYAVTYWLFERLGGLDEFAQRCLFGPLGMEQTGWTISDLQIEQGHGLDGRPQPVWHTNALSPAMGLKSSLNDVMTYLRSVFPTLVKKTPGPNSTLRKEISKLSRAGIFKVVDGWFLISSGSSLIYFHNGRTGGHQVSVAFIPGSRKGVVVFSNGALGSNDLCLLVLHMLVRAKNAGSNKGQEFLKM